jgi:pimeloyl-ACP methyl ester carboxylesterase
MRFKQPLVWALGFLQQAQQAPYPPPGSMVDVGGYRVHLSCVGEGSPTVVIAGAAFSFDWGLVQPEIAKFTRVCTYDPSGTAWSEAGRGASCKQRVDEIHRLLESARVESPVVMVGYSLGAIRARMYASAYPKEVAGMVIVDHAIDLAGAPTKRDGRPAPPKASGDLDSPPQLISMTPVAMGLEDDPAFAKLPGRNQELHRWAGPGAAALQTDEIVTQCLADGEALQDRLGAMPLAVVSTALQSPVYRELQARLVALSHNSRQIIAEKSGHGVIIDDPEVVIRAIRIAVEAVRTGGEVRTK